MIPEQQRRRGKALLICGCVWFTLALIWLPPLMLVLGWFRLPESFYRVLLPSEFVMSAFLAATGVVMWKSSAEHRVSIAVTLAAYAVAMLAVLVTFNLYGWIHLAH